MARKKRPSIRGIDPDYKTDFQGTKEVSTFHPAMPAETEPQPRQDSDARLEAEAMTEARREAQKWEETEAGQRVETAEDANDRLEAEAMAEARHEAQEWEEAEAGQRVETAKDANARLEAEAMAEAGHEAQECEEAEAGQRVETAKDANARLEAEAMVEAGYEAQAWMEKREIALDVAATAKQGDALKALEQQGFAMRDVIVKAGRRATGLFELKPNFVPKPEAERLPVRVGGYHTTKRLPATILDDLRQQHDPLRLKSDGAMVRGQFEPLFWACLDEVIEELQKK